MKTPTTEELRQIHLRSAEIVPVPNIESLKADIAATKKRAQAQEAQAAESWKKAQELEKELAKLENVIKFQKELFEEKL